MCYSIQRIDDGTHIMYRDTIEEAQDFLKKYPDYEAVPTNTSCIVVQYTELGGPWGYGHQEESFRTYGGIIRCHINLRKWVNEIIRTFGPDYRDIQDFFRHCSVEVNGKDLTSVFIDDINKLVNKNYLYI